MMESSKFVEKSITVEKNWKRWIMLLIYFGNTFNCSYQFANYIMIPDIYKEYFSVGNEQITWTSQVLSKILNRYRRKRPKLDASIFDSALSHNRRSDASEKREENCGQVSSPRLYRLRLASSY